MAVDQACFSCAATEQRCEKELEQMRFAVDAMDKELQVAIDDMEMWREECTKAKREARRLRRIVNGMKNEEPSDEETRQVLEYLEAWWTLVSQRFQQPRRPSMKPGSSAFKLVQVARAAGDRTHEEMMLHIQGVSLSDFHLQDYSYVKLSSLLSEDPKDPKRDERMQRHIDRARNYNRLVAEGFSPEMARQFSQDVVVKPEPKLAWGAPA